MAGFDQAGEEEIHAIPPSLGNISIDSNIYNLSIKFKFFSPEIDKKIRIFAATT
jgi:hypothetical protein